MAEVAHAAALNRGQFDRLIKVTRATSRYPQRDVLLLLLGHNAGLRVTETSRIGTPLSALLILVVLSARCCRVGNTVAGVNSVIHCF